MKWTFWLVAGVLIVATAAEVELVLLLSVLTGPDFVSTPAAVFVGSGVGWTLAGMFVSGPGRLRP